MESQNKKSKLSIILDSIFWIMLLILFIICVSKLVSSYYKSVEIRPVKTEIKILQQERDSVSKIISNELKSISEASSSNAEKSTNLIKQLPDEKIIIRDTTYNAMCEYITKFKPD